MASKKAKTKTCGYWRSQGKYEKENEVMSQWLHFVLENFKREYLIANPCKKEWDAFDLFWKNNRKNVWGLLNGMKGLYYGKFNDGDNARMAIANNRVHGHSSVESFLKLAHKYDAQRVIDYLNISNESRLEQAMDETIMIAWNSKKMNKCRAVFFLAIHKFRNPSARVHKDLIHSIAEYLSWWKD